MRGTWRAAGGSSEYSTVATTSRPAPAANSISVAPGARLTMRSGASRTLTLRPRSSTTVRAPATVTADSSASAARLLRKLDPTRVMLPILNSKAACIMDYATVHGQKETSSLPERDTRTGRAPLRVER